MIGTFFLCFAGIGAILSDGPPLHSGIGLVGIALAHGLALSIAVSVFGGISGAHVNPAVTAGMLVTGRIHPLLAVGYVIAQLLGAAAAATVCTMIFPPDAVSSSNLGVPLPMSPLPNWRVDERIILGAEFIMTFLLVTAVFGTAVDERGSQVKIGGFAIGLTIAFDILAGGTITGASMNPARSFGPALVGWHWEYHWCYWAAPIAGGIVAALVYHHFLLPTDYAQTETPPPRGMRP
jgi:MIP family channel proteins